MSREAHPAFWWIWAVFFSTALIRQDHLEYTVMALLSLTLLILWIGIPGHRVRIFAFTLRLAFFALAIRVLFAILIGVPLPGRVLFTLPKVDLPEFLVGIRIGGPVTSDRLSFGFSQGLLFATLILTFGVANSLSTPAQLIKAFPARLYGLGVAATLATTITPSIAKSVARIRTAQFLRGQSSRGIASWRRVGTPVLEEALARSIDLAAAMEARGYGLSRSPSKYRPQSWRTNDLISLAAIAYLAIFFPLLNLDSIWKNIVLALLIITPAVIR